MCRSKIVGVAFAHALAITATISCTIITVSTIFVCTIKLVVVVLASAQTEIVQSYNCVCTIFAIILLLEF